jgi:molybdopterin/thiamine biosynthesis adenylyltransferase
MYDRQQMLNLNQIDTATVVGCGGTGWWTALFLAMSGTKKLILIDPDTIEMSNLNRLPVTQERVTEYKADVLQKMIIKLRPECMVETYWEELDLHNIELCRGVIFCCTDNIASQQLLCAYAKKHNLPYQRVGYDGTVLNVSQAYPLTFETDIDNGYEIVPSWVVPAATAGALAVFSQMCSNVVIMGDMKFLSIKEVSSIPQRIKEKWQEMFLTKVEEGDFYGYGYCDSCNRGDCSDCERGDCSNCDTVYSLKDEVSNLEKINEEIMYERDALENEKAFAEELVKELKEKVANLTKEIKTLKGGNNNE